MNLMDKLITISELSNKLGLIKSKKGTSNHTIRYWEKMFKQIRPKLINNRRYYSSEQVKIIQFIKTLLKDYGMTIEGAKKVLSSNKKLDYNELHGLSEEYHKKYIKDKSKIIFDKVKKIKKIYGKKNTY